MKVEDNTGDSDALDLAEEEEIWNSADLNPQAKRIIVDLLHCKSRLMKANTGLQMALNACEDSKFDLENEYISLKNQVKSMQQLIKGSERFRKEMDEIQAALADSEKANHSLKASNNKLEKEIQALNHQIEAVTQEMSDMSFEREINKEKMTNLTHHFRALEHQLEEARMLLDEKDRSIYNKDVLIKQQTSSMAELTTIGQNLREKIKDLEDQLELAVIHEGGSFLHPDGTVSGVKENCLSLADELRMVSRVQDYSDDDSVEVDDVLLRPKITENPLSLADKFNLINGFQQEESDDVSVEVDGVLLGLKVTENPLSLADELRLVNGFQQEESDDDMEVDDVLISPTLIKSEDVVKVTGTEEVKGVIHVRGQKIELLETVEHETIIQQVSAAVDETVRSEEDKAVKPVEMTVKPAKTELEVSRPEERQQMVLHEEVRHLMEPKQEKDLEEISNILAEDSCHHEEIKLATGLQEVRHIDLESDMTAPVEGKCGIAPPEGVKESVKHHEVEDAIRTEDAKDFIYHTEALKHEGQRGDLSHTVEVEIPAQNEVQAVEVEQAQFRILDEDIAPDQNRYMLRIVVPVRMCLM